jgi:hypothetical protein
MTGVFVFVGPTLGQDEVRTILDGTCMPPVSQGDVYRLKRLRPRAVGIIDGYFHRVPAVWHKEIMWLMSEGVHVFGAASMGALRAAELESFGMRGVGAIFEGFRDGLLDRDDEVAVSHAGADYGYRPMSVAMVNIRATLAAAVNQGVIDSTVHDALRSAACGMFYADRHWPAILERGAVDGCNADQLAALRDWLPDGAVDQKALDARNMLRVMNDFVASDPPPLTVRWRLEDTLVWAAARNRSGVEILDEADVRATLLELVLDEIRLLGAARFREVQQRSVLRVLAVAEAEGAGYRPFGSSLAAKLEAFRRRRGLERGSVLQQFLDANELSIDDLMELVATEEKVSWATARAEQGALAGMLDDLRVAGDYVGLVERAREKAHVLAEYGMPVQAITDDALVIWYFNEVLETAVPDDLADYAYSSGFPDEHALRRAVRREWAFRTTSVPTDVMGAPS